MAGGSFGPAGVAKERAQQYQGKVTTSVIIACFIAAIGGSLFGYDVGISGGVTSNDEFLKKFFPHVYEKKQQAHENNYCKFDDQGLATFTSSLYFAGLVASLVASPITRAYGRRISIIIGGISFLIGASLNAAAVHIAMLLLGRILLGIGIGFGNQVSLHLQLSTLGIFLANMVNYGTQKLEPWGWRLSLGLAAFPAFFMAVGGMLLPETPNSLIERGLHEKGRKVLEKNRPQLVMAICLPASQIMTGINSILFYAPVLFESMGFGRDASLYSSASTGLVLFLSTFLSIAAVDKLGRRLLLISGGIIMQVIVSIILGLKFGENEHLTKGYSVLVVVVICLFVLGFGWSWGPLGWTVPSEIFPLEIRSAGQSQCFLSMLCAFKFGIFLFFAAWITVMTAFVYLFLPETKGVPIEETVFLWRKHWFWKKIVGEELEPHRSQI
ncbi:Sugar transport protein 7 [Linum perenne]